jgi:hypothetical protein
VAVDPTELTRTREPGPEMARTAERDQSVAPAATHQTVTHRDLRGRRQQFEARKVRRLIRHLDPWSVLKLSLVFFLAVWLVVIIASVIVWSVARGSGTIDKIENFVDSNFSTDWKFNGDFLLRQVGLVGLILTLGATLAMTVGAVMFNLISDIIGGVWITVIEEETARPVAGSPPE